MTNEKLGLEVYDIVCNELNVEGHIPSKHQLTRIGEAIKKLQVKTQ